MSGIDQHLQQIPNAVAIASSQDQSVSPEFKEQAIHYLNKVKELSQETWQACLMLYLQGAGASSPDSPGPDGKTKLSGELRVFCLQVVDDVLGNKPQVVTEQELQTLHNAMIGYVQAEFVEGSSEFGQAFMRNKFCYTLALVFLRLYPDTKPDFLAPFISFLSTPQSSSQANKLSATLLTLHTLCEIAAEIHDPLLKSARSWTDNRNARDGKVRDFLRKGDAGSVTEGCLGLIERGLGSGSMISGAEGESVEWALRTLASWAPWMDINTSVTQRSLSVYRNVIQHPQLKFSTIGLSIYQSLLTKGTKTPSEKLEIMRVLDVMSFLPELENSTSQWKGSERSEDQETFREGLAKLLAAQGVQALEVADDDSSDPNLKSSAETVATQTFPYLVRFLSDDRDEVALAVSPLLNEVLSLYKRARKTAGGELVLSEERQSFLATLLEALVRKMQWEEDATWSLGGEEDGDDVDSDEIDAFNERRTRIRADVEAIGVIVPDMMSQKILGFINSTFETVASKGYSAVPWQQAELAVHLTYIFGEIKKLGTGKEAFFIVPPEVSEILRIRAKEKQDVHRARAKGDLGPDGKLVEVPHHDPVDFSSFQLTPQGELLSRSISAGLLNYPHSAVVLQMLECAVRYCEFFKNRREFIQPVLAACVDSRGIHNENQGVARRVFYLFAKFVKNSRTAIETSFVAEILAQIGNALPIVAKLPGRENPDDDLLMKGTVGNTAFDNHLYLYEAVGTLIFLVREPEIQVNMMHTIMTDLVQGIDNAANQPIARGETELLRVLQLHHVIMAVGSLAKGFPDAPEILPETPPGWFVEFDSGINAILRALAIMKQQRVVRDASRSAFAGIVAALGPRVLPYIPTLVVNMASYFEPQEIVEFLGFLGLLAHKLKSTVFDMMDELSPIMFDRIYVLLGQEVNGTDETVLLLEIKKAYLTFCTTLLTNGLGGVFYGPRNNARMDLFVRSIVNIATTGRDRSVQKQAFGFLERTIALWATDPELGPASPFLTEIAAKNGGMPGNGDKKSFSGGSSNGSITPTGGAAGTQVVPGYQTMVYDIVLPAGFNLIMNKSFRLKDGQSGMVASEIASILRTLLVARKTEAINFFTNQFFPARNCPPEATDHIVTRLRSDDVKGFRKTFSEFIKDWRTQLGIDAPVLT